MTSRYLWNTTVLVGFDASAEVRQYLKKTKMGWMAATCPVSARSL